MIKLGEMVRDTVLGIEGTVTQRSERLHSPPMLWVEGFHNGMFFERWIDESRLRLVDGKPMVAPTPIRVEAK